MRHQQWIAGIFLCPLMLAAAALGAPLPSSAPALPVAPVIPAAPATPSPWALLPPGSSATPWTIVVLLTVLTLLPALLLAMTPFVRLLVIFHFLRQALGTNTIPTNQTLIGLALFLTWFLMAPVGAAIYQKAVVPLQSGSIDAVTALQRGSVPMRDFMLKYSREKDLALFVELAHEPRPRRPQDLTLRVVVPAYMISELKTGFQIGAVLFIPFLVIDMAVASITTSVGMMQLPPVVISTPLKILVFVMADGWHLLVGAIMKSFY
jgi:flagellar biosynthetic protein FliP